MHVSTSDTPALSAPPMGLLRIRRVAGAERGTLGEARPKICAGPAKAQPQPSALEQRIAQLEMALNTAPVGVATLDLQFRYTTVNKAFAHLYGKKVEEFIGRTVEEALPKWAPQIVKHLADALAAEAAVECEIYLTAGDTEELLVYLRTCQPMRDAAGEVVGLAAGLIDITARKQAEVRLRESEDHYRRAVEFNPHIPWTCGPDGELFDISPRWTTLTGQKSGRITLADWAETPHPDDLPIVSEAWVHCRQTGEPLDVEYRVRCADGKMRWIRARATPHKEGEGRILRWYGIIEDVENRHQIYAALQEETRRLKGATEQLSLMVREDHLTGLANRRHFDMTTEREVHLALRSGRGLGLVMIDVDMFKSYNDTYGHVAGDACLRQIGVALRKVVRTPADLVARYGGEEFAIVLPDTTEDQALQVAARAAASLRSLRLEHPCRPPGIVTLSAGVAMLPLAGHRAGSPAVLASDLIQMADLALYAAKKAGRDCILSAEALRRNSAAAGPGADASPLAR